MCVLWWRDVSPCLHGLHLRLLRNAVQCWVAERAASTRRNATAPDQPRLDTTYAAGPRLLGACVLSLHSSLFHAVLIYLILVWASPPLYKQIFFFNM